MTESLLTRKILISICYSFLFLFVIIPIIAIFGEGLKGGVYLYLQALENKETVSALILSLKVTAIVVPLNLLFGLAASWAISKFQFPGKQFLISLIDLPLSVSPVIAGLVYILIFNSHTVLGKWLLDHNIQILYATPSIILATLFVTFPYIARELIPLMQQQGNDEEEAATLLGSSGMNTFFRITLPNIKWGLLYGSLICTARALGEFGAVSVVSGNIQGLTNTLPLQIEALFNEYNYTAAFAVASLLTVTAIFTLILKALIEYKTKKYEH